MRPLAAAAGVADDDARAASGRAGVDAAPVRAAAVPAAAMTAATQPAAVNAAMILGLVIARRGRVESFMPCSYPWCLAVAAGETRGSGWPWRTLLSPVVPDSGFGSPCTASQPPSPRDAVARSFRRDLTKSSHRLAGALTCGFRYPVRAATVG